MGGQSLAQTLTCLPPDKRAEIMRALSVEAAELLQTEWRFWARPDQLAPDGNWYLWMVMSGRGWGKTRVGAEWVRANIDKYPIVHLVGATAKDLRQVMVEGSSGILSVFPKGQTPTYNPTNTQVTFHNGAKALLYSAEEPERLRGPQCYAFWADELAAWERVQETWDNLMMGFRLGAMPRGIITTTPRPIPLIKELLKTPHVHVTKGSTYDNIANLPASYVSTIIRKYEGTRLGRQELHAEVLEDVEGALWLRPMIDENRAAKIPDDLERVVVGIDPSISGGDDADEAGIVVAGCRREGRALHAYVFGDYSLIARPNVWAKRAIDAYRASKADRIVAEKNQGGEMVELTIRTVDASVPYKAVHAARGKITRAEPIAALYEQKRVHHVGQFMKLEDEMCTYLPGKPSPNRMDALVHALTDLMLGGHADPLELQMPTSFGRRESPWRV